MVINGCGKLALPGDGKPMAKLQKAMIAKAVAKTEHREFAALGLQFIY